MIVADRGSRYGRLRDAVAPGRLDGVGQVV